MKAVKFLDNSSTFRDKSIKTFNQDTCINVACRYKPNIESN